MDVVHIVWDNETKTAIRAEFVESWTWEDFHRAVAEIHHMIAQYDHTIDIIIWHHIHMPPENPISHFSRTLRTQPQNTGRIVIVLPPMNKPLDRFLMTLAGIVQRTYPNRSPVISVRSIEEARSILGQLQAARQG